MKHQPPETDYSILDRPELLQRMFHPRRDWRPPPPDATDHPVAVADGVSLSCRFYAGSTFWPSILFFHGNGEAASDYDRLAALYRRHNLNLFAAEYRGYGASDGTPSFSSMIADARIVFEYFQAMLQAERYLAPLLVMGRSLGSQSAVEVAARYPDRIKGLVIESGFATLSRQLVHLEGVIETWELETLAQAQRDKIRSINMPVLIIHGEEDATVPLEAAEEFYEIVGSSQKHLLSIPGAGHNDLLLWGAGYYFSALRRFAYEGIQ